jgi:hypothetical protein
MVHTHLNNVLVLQLAQKLDFTDSRHIETVFELPDFDLFNGYLAIRASLPSYRPSVLGGISAHEQ